MKREEAIQILEEEANYLYKDDEPYCRQAFYMAIEALQAKTDGDLISRQDAIRWVKTECNPYGKPTLDFESGKRVIEHLNQMPSAETPTVSEKHQLSEETPTDLISRQALCQYALNQKDKSVTPNDIMRFPSAELKTGEWIMQNEELKISDYRCSECGHYQDDKTDFCPNCGAKMAANIT